MYLTVLGGDFKADRKARYHRGKWSLARQEGADHLLVRYVPSDLRNFEVIDGSWGEYWNQVGDWAKVILAGAKAGLPAAAANEVLRGFFPGQRFLLSIAGSVLGAAGAKKALASGRLVSVRATFKDGSVLRAKVRERELTRYLPQLVNHLIADREKEAK